MKFEATHRRKVLHTQVGLKLCQEILLLHLGVFSVLAFAPQLKLLEMSQPRGHLFQVNSISRLFLASCCKPVLGFRAPSLCPRKAQRLDFCSSFSCVINGSEPAALAVFPKQFIWSYNHRMD